nr:MAG TPA: hypothetical protein [Caudoviricetes sp.]
MKPLISFVIISIIYFSSPYTTLKFYLQFLHS